MKHHKLPRSLIDRDKFIIEKCKGNRVLHVGFADFPFTVEKIASGKWLHSHISSVASECVGVDLDKNTVDLLREKYGKKNILVGNAESLDQINCNCFDIVVAGEIIEHLNNPGLFLSTAKKVLSPGGLLIITTVNAFCLRRLIRIPFGYESVHSDHTYYFSHVTLHTLVSRYDYRLVEAHSYSLTYKRPLIPYAIERLSTVFSPNLGEGIIRVYES